MRSRRQAKRASALAGAGAAPRPRSGETLRRQDANNRLAPGIYGSRRSRALRWRAFDQLPERVAEAIRDSQSLLCPVAALRLVKCSNHSPETIANFLRKRAAWTDWRVLAADFGREGATRLRPDAPRWKPKLGLGRKAASATPIGPRKRPERDDRRSAPGSRADARASATARRGAR